MSTPQRKATSSRQNFRLDDILVPLQRLRFIVTPERIRSLFSSPLTLIPAIPGHYRRPIFWDMYQEVGTAYTGHAAAGNIELRLGGVAISQGGTQSATSLLGGTGDFYVYSIMSAAPVGVKLSTGDNTNKAISVGLQLADVTAGSGRMIMQLIWRDIPNRPLPW